MADTRLQQSIQAQATRPQGAAPQSTATVLPTDDAEMQRLRRQRTKSIVMGGLLAILVLVGLAVMVLTNSARPAAPREVSLYGPYTRTLSGEVVLTEPTNLEMPVTDRNAVSPSI